VLASAVIPDEKVKAASRRSIPIRKWSSTRIEDRLEVNLGGDLQRSHDALKAHLMANV